VGLSVFCEDSNFDLYTNVSTIIGGRLRLFLPLLNFITTDSTIYNVFL